MVVWLLWKPRVLLRASEDFQLTGRWEFDAAYGIEALPDGRLLIGEDWSVLRQGHQGSVRLGRADANQGVVLEPR